MNRILITHEAIGNWARRLRPLKDEWSLRCCESRSRDDLCRLAQRSARPVVLMDIMDISLDVLDDLAALKAVAPDALCLVLVPRDQSRDAELAWLAGATVTVDRSLPPPVVLNELKRLVDIAGQRATRDGWSVAARPEPEVWEAFLVDDTFPVASSESVV